MGKRVKVRLVHVDTGHVHNDSSSGWQELQERVAKRCGAGGFVLQGEDGLELQGEDGWRLLMSMYQEGVQQQQNGCATYRVKLLVKPAGPCKSRTPQPASAAAQQAPPHKDGAASKAQSRRTRPARQPSDASKRACHRRNDFSSNVVTTQETEATLAKQQAAVTSPVAVIGSAAWDEQVLQSIKRTVTKLHFGSRLASQPPPA